MTPTLSETATVSKSAYFWSLSTLFEKKLKIGAGLQAGTAFFDIYLYDAPRFLHPLLFLWPSFQC